MIYVRVAMILFVMIRWGFKWAGVEFSDSIELPLAIIDSICLIWLCLAFIVFTVRDIMEDLSQ